MSVPRLRLFIYFLFIPAAPPPIIYTKYQTGNGIRAQDLPPIFSPLDKLFSISARNVHCQYETELDSVRLVGLLSSHVSYMESQ